MSDTEHTTQGEDDLGRLALAVERLLAEGTSIDVEALAREHGVPVADAQDVVDALDAFGDVLFEPLQPAHAEDDAALPPPTLPADYEIRGELGRGGMGIVYRAHQRSLGRDVAIKVLRPGELTFGKMLRRFEQEAKSLARLKHPHIVSIHEVGNADGCVYFTMDLVEGKPLSELVRERQITPTEAVRLLRQVTSAIAYTHGLGVIHRDLKPANILVDTESRAFVVDFGLARDLAGPDESTRTGQVIGTANYMSPEQARGAKDRIGETTDVYALGAVLYECLTGKPPFSGKGLAELMTAILHEEPEPPTKADPRVPKALETICLKAMAKDPDRRYATARALLDDLERFEEGKTIRARRPGLVHRVRAGWQRHWRLATVGLGAAIVTGLGVLLLLLPRTGETVDSLTETASNLARERKYDAAAAVLERAMQLRGLRIPEAGEDITSPLEGGHDVDGLVHLWAYYKSRHVGELYEGGAYSRVLGTADATLALLPRVAEAAGLQDFRHREIDIRWNAALAAARLRNSSAAARFRSLYELIRALEVPRGRRAWRHYPFASARFRLGRIRMELGPILADPEYELHAWVRRFACALLATEGGREALLSQQPRSSPHSQPETYLPAQIEAIVRGATRDAHDRALEDPQSPSDGAREATIDTAWFDVRDDFVIDTWRNLRNLLRRIAVVHAERVYAALESLVAENGDSDPLVARWALGLLAIGLDLPPFWDRDRPPPPPDPKLDDRIWKLARASRTASGRAFLAERMAAAKRLAQADDRALSERVRRWLADHRITIEVPADADGNVLEQDLLRGLIDPESAPSCHARLVQSAKDRASSVLWGEWVSPLASSGLQAGDETLYRMWLSQLVARGSKVVREDAVVSYVVLPYVDGRPVGRFRGLGASLLRWSHQPVGLEQLAPVYGGWTSATAWPESNRRLTARRGLVGITWNPRRRMISEPGTALAELNTFWRVRIRPGGLGLALSGEHADEWGDTVSRWVRTSEPPRGDCDVGVLRFERRPRPLDPRPQHRQGAEPSQSAIVMVRIRPRDEAEDEPGRRGWVPWSAKRLEAIVAEDPKLEQPGQRERVRRLAQILSYAPAPDGGDALRSVALGALDAGPTRGLHDALMLAGALRSVDEGRRWLATAEDARIERGLEVLEMTTPLARAELWVRLLRVSTDAPAVRATVLRRLEALARDNAEAFHVFAGVFSELAPRTGDLERFTQLHQATAFARELRADREPSVFAVVAPYVLLVLAAIGLLLALVLTWGALTDRRTARLALTGFGLGWVLAGQQVFALPDVDFFVECVGLLLMWRALVAVAPTSARRERSVPELLLVAALAAGVLEKADTDTDVMGRLVIAFAGLALAAIPFWLDRLQPPSTGRWRWTLPLLATLTLAPSVFIATVQGPQLDQYDAGAGLARPWQAAPTHGLTLTYLVGVAVVIASLVAYVRRAVRAS